MNATDHAVYAASRERFSLFERVGRESAQYRYVGCWNCSKSAEMVAASGGSSTGDAAGFACGGWVLPEGPAGHDRSGIRQFVQRVYPERHGGSELAAGVTAWLLELERGMNE